MSEQPFVQILVLRRIIKAKKNVRRPLIVFRRTYQSLIVQEYYFETFIFK
jgi:hypothetical protein